MPSTSDTMTLQPHTRTTPEEQLAALCINTLERHQRALALIPGTEEVSGGLEYLKDAVWRLAKGEGERGMLGLIGRDERPVEAAELEQVAA